MLHWKMKKNFICRYLLCFFSASVQIYGQAASFLIFLDNTHDLIHTHTYTRYDSPTRVISFSQRQLPTQQTQKTKFHASERFETEISAIRAIATLCLRNPRPLGSAHTVNQLKKLCEKRSIKCIRGIKVHLTWNKIEESEMELPHLAYKLLSRTHYSSKDIREGKTTTKR